jgi:hypothetical protein
MIKGITRSDLLHGGVMVIALAIVAVLQIPQLEQLKNKSINYDLDSLNKEQSLVNLKLDFLEKMPSFGLDNVVANLTFMEFLGYFGDESARNITGYQDTFNYFDVIVGKDPRFIDSYLFLSNTGTIYAGQPEKAIALTEQGLKSLTPALPKQSHFVWRYKGLDELLFLGDSQAAQKSFETAAEWAFFHQDEVSQRVGDQSKQTAEFLANNPDSVYAQIGAWSMLLTNTRDKFTQNLAIAKIESLGGKVDIDEEGRVRIVPPAED